jgi:hypothetical protein
VTTRPLTVQIDAAFEVTEVVPSPVVLTVALKVPPTTADVGRLVMVGVDGVAATASIVNVCEVPSAAA